MRLLHLLCATLLLCSTTVTAQTDAGTTLLAAESALTGGDPGRTLALTGPVLAEQPNNFAAIFLRALALSDLGRDVEAAETAARAYRAAQTRDESLQAARLAGGARFAARQYVRAEWWLRRAANHIGSPQDVAVLLAEFSRIRDANPLTAQFNFNVAPTDNINNGAESETFRLEGLDFEFGLPPTSVALSGTEYSGDAALSYRISRSDRQETRLATYLFGRTFTLSEEAQDRVPDLSGSDFALALADFSINQQWRISPEGPTNLSFGVGRVWFGGDILWDYRRIGLGQDIQFSPVSRLSVTGTLEDQEVRNPAFVDPFIYGLQIGYQRIRLNRDQWRVGLAARRYATGDIEESFNDISLTAGYDFDETPLGTSLSLDIGVGQTVYEEFSLSLDGRRDEYATLGGTVVFEDISYFGFSPNISLSARRTRSNVDQFNSSQIQGRIGITSNF